MIPLSTVIDNSQSEWRLRLSCELPGYVSQPSSMYRLDVGFLLCLSRMPLCPVYVS